MADEIITLKPDLKILIDHDPIGDVHRVWFVVETILDGHCLGAGETRELAVRRAVGTLEDAANTLRLRM